MNKKLAAASGGIALVAAAIAVTAGTYSYFTDTESVGPQTVTAGTLNLSVGGSALETSVFAANLAPGAPAVSKTITVDNIGSLDGKLRATAHATGDSNLLSVARFSISGGGYNTGEVALSNLNVTNVGVGNLPATDGPQQYTITVRLPDSVGNAVQGKTASFDFKLDLLQSNAPDNTEAFPA